MEKRDMGKAVRAAAATAIAFATVSAGNLAAGPASAQQSFRIICRGNGAPMRAEIDAAGASIVLFFRAGTVGAAQTPPAAGQCTWNDRGFRPGEPDRLIAFGARAIAYIAEYMSRPTIFTVDGFNNGQGAMTVTDIGS